MAINAVAQKLLLLHGSQYAQVVFQICQDTHSSNSNIGYHRKIAEPEDNCLPGQIGKLTIGIGNATSR
jgi:hypothetical protein